jgi:cell wall-associated NlpC family hydrolase
VPPARPSALALLAASALLSAGCAGPAASGSPAGGPTPDELAVFDLQARLSARAASLVGRTGDFRAGGERFPADCTGFVEAVYQAEGVPLRALLQRAAPDERHGVEAAWRAMRAYGAILPSGDWPAPGDLVFWRNTYDRDRNGRADDGLTHVGVVLYVVDGNVVFAHRGGHAVARGAMDPRRPHAGSVDGAVVNTPIRKRDARLEGVPVLAGELFAGYGRIDPRRVPRIEGAASP